MKTSLLLGVAAAALILAAPQASAAGYKPYVSVFGGGAWLTKNPNIATSGYSTNYDLLVNNPGYIIGGAVGVDWENQLRTELELSHAHWGADRFQRNRFVEGAPFHTIDGGNSDVSATYLMGNVWYDLTHGTQVTPYVGGGLGIGWANINSFDGDSSFNASGLAFQIGAGVRVRLADHVSLDAGYRFKDIVGLNYMESEQGGSPDGEIVTDHNLASHNFQVGLTFDF